MLTTCGKDQLYLLGVREQAVSEDRAKLTFFTTRGDLEAYTRTCHGVRQAVVLLGGDEGEIAFDSEYDRLSRDLAKHRVGSVLVDYRNPGDCAQCAIDALLACQYLDDEGISDVLLIGWSFGATVALAAGSVARIVRGVAAISPVDVADCCVRRMHRRSLLVLRGDNDELCPSDTARRAGVSRENLTRVLTYPGQGHELSGVRQQLHSELMNWIGQTLKADCSRQDVAVRANA